MAWFNLSTRTTADANASADINVLMENVRVLGGNGTSAPSSDIETLFTNAVSLTSQAGAPSSTPSAVGQFNLDTTGNRFYVSTGTASSADWDKVAVYAYGTETITSGGGDVTVNLPWDWSDGALFIYITDTSTEYFSDNGSQIMSLTTTYDAITSGSYSTDHMYYKTVTPSTITWDKSSALGGVPKSATTASFTMDDNETVYVKWMVMA